MAVLSLLLSGIAVGCIYALVALAINLVFAARKVVNFAQGDLVMLAGLFGVWLIAKWGLPYFAGLLGACLLVALLALLMERVALRGLPRDEGNLAWILSIVAVSIITSNAAQLIFGTDTRSIPSLLPAAPLRFGAVAVAPDQLAAIGATLCLFAIFHVGLNRTVHGKALKAAARDPDMALLLGIEVRRYIAASFALAGVLAACASFLIGPLTFVNAAFGFSLGIKGFAAAALGGLGTFGGAVLGGLVIGITEALASFYLGDSVKDGMSLALLCVILLFRPMGLVGEIRVVKV